MDRNPYKLLSLFLGAVLILVTIMYMTQSQTQVSKQASPTKITKLAVKTPRIQTSDAIPDFALIDQNGFAHRFSRYEKYKAFVLYVHGVGCPIVRNQAEEYARLKSIFEKNKIAFFMINANVQDARESIRLDLESLGIDIPTLKDRDQLLSEIIKITRTGEAIVANPKTGKILFRGPIDDRMEYGTSRNEVSKRYLEDTLNAILHNRKIPQSNVKVKGCAISKIDDASVIKRGLTFTQHIAPILKERCRPCHVAGGVAPWAMDRYETIFGWRAMMREVILNKRMPPNQYDPLSLAHSSQKILTPSETRQIIYWIDSGAPRGTGEDPFKGLSGAPEANLKDADLVIELPWHEIPASGLLEYVYQIEDIPLKEDKWVKSMKIVPSSPQNVHHAVVLLASKEMKTDVTEELALLTKQSEEGYFAGVSINAKSIVFPHGSGRLIKKGERFVFQLHYVTTGKKVSNRIRMGLWFHDKPPEYELKVTSAYTNDIKIPPFAKDFKIEATKVVEEDFGLIEFVPHMHSRGSRFTYEAILPNNTVRKLFSIPMFDFNFQTKYSLGKPMRLPKGTAIHVEGYFDNSAENPLNPDPKQTVGFGLQSSDEMMIGYMKYLIKRL